jgi:hypothetical protein
VAKDTDASVQKQSGWWELSWNLSGILQGLVDQSSGQRVPPFWRAPSCMLSVLSTSYSKPEPPVQSGSVLGDPQ